MFAAYDNGDDHQSDESTLVSEMRDAIASVQQNIYQMTYSTSREAQAAGETGAYGNPTGWKKVQAC